MNQVILEGYAQNVQKDNFDLVFGGKNSRLNVRVDYRLLPFALETLYIRVIGELKYSSKLGKLYLNTFNYKVLS